MRSALLAVSIVLLNWSTNAFAQALPGELELIRERQERVLEEQRRRLQELQQLTGERPAQSVTEPSAAAQCFDVQRIRLAGTSLISSEQQSRLFAPFVGQCLGTAQLNEVLKAVTSFYLYRGYVTARAYLPEQDLSDAELKVLVIEGTLEGLDSSTLANERELAMAFPGKEGDLLNLRELEQLVDQLARLPSRQVQLELLPGEEAGGSRVQLQGTRSKPWHLSFSRHNDGQASTGEQQWGAGLVLDSPLRLGDQLRLRGGADAVSDQWRHSANQSIVYSVPYGWWSFDYSYSQSYYRTRNKAAGFSFASEGESKRHQLRAERVMHRDAVSKTAVSAGVAHLRTRNYIENALIDGSSNRLSELQLGANHGRRIGNAFINGDLGWQRGIGAFDAQRSGRPQGSQPVARYDKYSFTGSYLQPFRWLGESFSIDSLVNGQHSEDVLFGPQRISLGGLSSVRGYKEQALSGDSGYYWRSNLRWRRAITSPVISPWLQEYALAAGYDLGRIRSSGHNASQHGRLSGNAVEASVRGKHFTASFTLARSLVRPDAISRNEHPAYFRFDLFF